MLASACLTTTFVWTQHLGAVHAVANAGPAVRETWLADLCRGRTRAGMVLAGALPRRPPLLRAEAAPGGWSLRGTAPWLSGWGLIDVVHVAARDADDSVVWLLADASKAPTFRVDPLRLLAVNASATVTATFDGHFVAAERVTQILPAEQWNAPNPGMLRLHASLALGVADRACRLLGAGALDAEVDGCREMLDGPLAKLVDGRARAAELALRAASALVVEEGSGALVDGSRAGRLAREAMFLLVFGSRPPIRTALLERLTLN